MTIEQELIKACVHLSGAQAYLDNLHRMEDISHRAIREAVIACIDAADVLNGGFKLITLEDSEFTDDHPGH